MRNEHLINIAGDEALKFSRLTILEMNDEILAKSVHQLFQHVPQNEDPKYASYVVKEFYEACMMPRGLKLKEFDMYVVGNQLHIQALFINSSKQKVRVDKKLTVEIPRFVNVVRRPDLREPWQIYFMKKAREAAARTTCASGRSVGAIFVRDKSELMTSYNGVPPNYPHPRECARVVHGCKSGEGLDLCPCNHAEQNAISFASREGVCLKGSTLYVTSRPCVTCMGMLAVIGINKVIYDVDYPHPVSTEIAKYANIKLFELQQAIELDEM